jgi:hypothetical protein
VRGLLRRTWPERLAAARAVVSLSAARAALVLAPFPTVLRWAGRLGGGAPGREGSISLGTPVDAAAPSPTPPVLPAPLARRLWAVNAVGRRLFSNGPCLPQALVAHVYLRRAGLPADLRIGTRKDAAGAVEAHAWVESSGHVLMGDLPDLDSYTPLAPGASLHRPRSAG